MQHYWLSCETQNSKILILPTPILPSHAQKHSSRKAAELTHTAVKRRTHTAASYINMQIKNAYRHSLPIENTSCYRQQNHFKDLALVNWQIPPGGCYPINHGPFGQAAFLNRFSPPF